MKKKITFLCGVLQIVSASALLLSFDSVNAEEKSARSVEEVFAAVEDHDFHPIVSGFTRDRNLGKAGVASLEDPDWKILTLALRDLARLGPGAEAGILDRLSHGNSHVRYLAAAALGIRGGTAAVGELAEVLRADPEMWVRSQAAIALRQIGDPASVPALEAALKDGERDVQHQARLAVEAIEARIEPDEKLRAAFRSLDEETFETAAVGGMAPDFALPDTQGNSWRLSDFRGRQPVVLVWIFADW